MKTLLKKASDILDSIYGENMSKVEKNEILFKIESVSSIELAEEMVLNLTR